MMHLYCFCFFNSYLSQKLHVLVHVYLFNDALNIFFIYSYMTSDSSDDESFNINNAWALHALWLNPGLFLIKWQPSDNKICYWW